MNTQSSPSLVARYEAVTLSRVVVCVFADLTEARAFVRAFVRASRVRCTLRYARKAVSA